MSNLELRAKLVSGHPGKHGHVNIYQNGTFAGHLDIDPEFVTEVIGILNAGTELVEALKATLASYEDRNRLYPLQGIIQRAHAALAKYKAEESA